MGEVTKIQWAGSSWNPWHGCKKVSAGCKFCYMYRDKIKFGQDPTIVVRSKTKFNEPLKWKEQKLIFTCSWSDWFIQEADDWRKEAWEIIKATPQHTYQILTKRPERIFNHLPDDWGEGYPNVWIGVSVEDQEAADLRIPLLAKVSAAIKFLSCEPLLNAVNLSKYLWVVDWIIVGGESGNDNGKYQYRQCWFGWIEQIIYDCKEAKKPVFVKQVGTYLAKQLGYKDRHGGDINEWHETIRIREMPKIFEAV